MLGGIDDRIGGDFCAGARGAGEGDDGHGLRGKREALAHYLQVVHEVAVVTQEDSDCLARIDDGSASERNDNVRSEVLSCGDGGPDSLHRGLALAAPDGDIGGEAGEWGFVGVRMVSSNDKNALAILLNDIRQLGRGA